MLDEATFEDLADRHRHELRVHCYRMLANVDEAEDAVQEALLRAWRGRETLGEAPNTRAWLYRIATNVCLDELRRRRRRVPHHAPMAEIPWLQPYPDRLLDAAVEEAGPDALAVARETVELAFIAALQVLPATQRAVLLLRDVMGLTAAEAAAHLGTSVAAANSALQRARATLRDHVPSGRLGWSAAPPATEVERALLARFIEAHERGDASAALAVAARDIRVTMPPNPMVVDGREGVAALLERAFDREQEGDWRLLPTAANRMPAAASYLRRPGDTAFRAFKLDVLRVEAGAIAEITTFGWSHFPGLGLPATLD